jgi:hypothetical protein
MYWCTKAMAMLPSPTAEHRPERDRHLAEDVAREPLPDDALDPVGEPHRLDPALEHREQRALGALVRGVLARDERDVGRHPRQPLTSGGVERLEQRDLPDLVCGDHARDSTRLRGSSRPWPWIARTA